MKINKRGVNRTLTKASLMLLAGLSQSALAIDWYVSGFVRQEGAYSIDSKNENPWNQSGNVYNGVAAPNVVDQLLGIPPGTVTRPASFTESNDWNVMLTRAEIDIDATINDNWKFVAKVRGLYAWDTYDSGPGETNYFESPFRGECATRLEVCGSDYMVDLPSLYLDYNSGPLWLRIGNQQIAWGESIFFRVLDNPNGLDLRRHSAFDWASEEFSDKRVPALGIRGSYRFQNDWELEGWIQEFQPTVLSNANTPYNPITSTFTVHQEEGFDAVDDEFNFGARLRGQIGELGLQFTFTDRMNPDGAFRWTESGINVFDRAGIADPGIGGLLAQTPFEPISGGLGIYSAEQWMTEAAGSRLNGSNLQALLDDFPAAQALVSGALGNFGLPPDTPVDNYALSTTVLDAFFSPNLGLGEFKGHIERTFHREEIYGFGANYMFFGEPDSFIDQLIVRFEATYTPDRVFTDPSLLGADFLVEDEYITSLVVEKYHRFSQGFPATYMVFQWLHKSESDIFGRHLDGYGANTFGPPTGRSSFNAVSFAFQQPSPTLKWRTDFAFLYDTEGGYLVQPGIRYKPSKSISAELFANFVGGGDDNMDAMSTFDFVEELAFRLTYQF
jgi:hypothetical protein